MRIAQVAPLYERVPPRRYGGTERVVYWLCQELARRGHQVTLFASADSEVPGVELVPMVDQPLRGTPAEKDAAALHVAALRMATERRPAFDLIHSHVDAEGLPLFCNSAVPIVTTLHGRLDRPEFQRVASGCLSAPLVAISESQKRDWPAGRWLATIPHGLPLALHPFVAVPEAHLAFVGRISRDKRPDLAIRAARAAGMKLKIAAKINGDSADGRYLREVILPLLGDGNGVEFEGEVGDEKKPQLMGAARALLFPIEWPEPFGLVAIEAMAYGTPVITRPFGALPEIVEDGKTGFLVDDLESMVRAIRSVGSLERSACRDLVRRRFSAATMADRYEAVYHQLRRPGFRDLQPAEPV